MPKVKLTIGRVFSYLVVPEPHWPRISSITVEPRYFEVPREMGKKLEIAGFQRKIRSNETLLKNTVQFDERH